MLQNEKLGIVTKIIDCETVEVKVIHANENRILKGEKNYIHQIKLGFEDEDSEHEGIVIIKFNSDTNKIVEDIKEDDF